MLKKIKKHERTLLVILIVICIGIVFAEGAYYLRKLERNLQEDAIHDVMTVTVQQQQAFDTFIFGDQERLHSYAQFFSANDHINAAEDIQMHLKMFNEVNAIYSVICLDEGWFCSNVSEDILQLEPEKLDFYKNFEGSGIRDTYIGLSSGTPKFGLYETFTFNNGHKGLIQKSYDRSRISETFSLSFYNDEGLSYVVNQKGDILLRSIDIIDDNFHDNISDILTDIYSQQEDIDSFMEALRARETGSTIFTGDRGAYVYTYVPAESIEEWYLVSIVPLDAISAETERIVLDSQMAVGFFALILITCIVFIVLIWRTHKDIEAKEQEAAYQTQLFHIFTTFLSNNTDDVYIILDLETNKAEYVSPNIKRVLGLEPEEALSALIAEDMAQDPSAAKARHLDFRALNPGNATEPRNTERVNPITGEQRYFLETVYCALVQGQTKWVLYISDRTKEHKAQSSLSEALNMAQAANKAKSSFLSSISHDIRTPMNAIIGFLSLMRNEVNHPDIVLEYTQRIDAASQHLLGLINDVLDMNKIENGSATLNISEMDLAEVIDEINTIIRPQTRARNQIFDIFTSHLNYEHLLGDKLRINQILINLLSNAVKYTPENGRIQMRVEELPQVVNNYSRIRFTISDNGMGMSEDYLKVIFDPFTREETETVRHIQGTGLGMAITKSLVDLMGGTIHVESELDKGSTFLVELELRIQEQEDDPQFWTDHSVSRMIVVDDDEDVCFNIVKTMSQTGVSIDYSTDGAKAVQIMRTARESGRPYDLILLDWKMPTLNGLEVARLIRKNYSKKIPILLLTAYDWSEIEEEATEIGVNHFMPKPFFMCNFKDAIRRVMGSRKQKEEDARPDVVRDKHILVVDDIEVNRIILVKILDALGAVCDIASNGQEAVAKFEASKPGDFDLILMDVQMPVMDGYTATRTIRSSDHPSAKTIPIIAMTANAFVDDVRDALKSGMNAHIAKPIQLDKLKDTLAQVLG